MTTIMYDDGQPVMGRKMMLATSVYDSPDFSYTFSIAKSRVALIEAGINHSYLLMSGNCHVDDARNSIVQQFLESDCTNLLFLDADVSWQPDDLISLCDAPGDIIGGVYPYRREDGKAKRGMPYIGKERAGMQDDGRIEVLGLPTGFMKIDRRVFDSIPHETYAGKNKEQTEIPLFFERALIEGVRMGGDLMFCTKARAAGFKLHALYDLVLGHSTKTVLKDSLGAYLRRQDNTCLPRLVDRIQYGEETPADFQEAVEYIDNPWGASDEVLIVATSAARTAKGDIIEAGSGLTTIVMAAANPDYRVYCMEHNEHFADQTRAMAHQCGLTNIAIIHCGLKDDWYELTGMDILALPSHFGVGLSDGPPRQLGDRTKFLDVFGARCDLIVADDADDPTYAQALTSWAEEQDRIIHFPELRTAIIMKETA